MKSVREIEDMILELDNAARTTKDVDLKKRYYFAKKALLWVLDKEEHPC